MLGVVGVVHRHEAQVFGVEEEDEAQKYGEERGVGPAALDGFAQKAVAIACRRRVETQDEDLECLLDLVGEGGRDVGLPFAALAGACTPQVRGLLAR